MTNKLGKCINETSAKLNLEIKTYDIDIAGHVNNTVYLRWFEDIRTKLFDEYFNLSELLSQNLYPVVISTEIKYKKFLKLFDKPVGVMRVVGCNHGIILLQAEIRLNGKVAATGNQKCALIDLDKSVMVNGNVFKEIIESNVDFFTSEFE